MKRTSVYPLIFLISATCTLPVLHVSTSAVGGSDVFPSDTVNGNDVIKLQREKRMSMYLSVKGAEMVKKLTRGAKQIESKEKNARVFIKPGSFMSAVGEFKALKPTNVHGTARPSYQTPVVSGQVGNTLIVIEKKGKSGKATMTILREKNGKYDQADTIIYTDNRSDQ